MKIQQTLNGIVMIRFYLVNLLVILILVKIKEPYRSECILKIFELNL